ncbi:hypothetical protein [Candidatus Pantoea soli]|nr:hypothetical protein [Pantoea soli]
MEILKNQKLYCGARFAHRKKKINLIYAFCLALVSGKCAGAAPPPCCR